MKLKVPKKERRKSGDSRGKHILRNVLIVLSIMALMALAGDLGCSAGPTVAGVVAGALGDNLRAGILCGLAFPLLMTVGVLLMKRLSHEKTPQG